MLDAIRGRSLPLCLRCNRMRLHVRPIYAPLTPCMHMHACRQSPLALATRHALPRPHTPAAVALDQPAAWQQHLVAARKVASAPRHAVRAIRNCATYACMFMSNRVSKCMHGAELGRTCPRVRACAPAMLDATWGPLLASLHAVRPHAIPRAPHIYIYICPTNPMHANACTYSGRAPCRPPCPSTDIHTRCLSPGPARSVAAAAAACGAIVAGAST